MKKPVKKPAPDANIEPEFDKNPPTQSIQHERLLSLFDKTKGGQLGKIDAEKAFGAEWIKVKAAIKATPGQTIQQYVRVHGLPFTHQYANGAGRLANAYDDFRPAHDWYQQAGIADGWRTNKNAGWEYALEVIALHKKARRGESPDRGTKSGQVKETPSKRIKRLEQEAADREQKLSLLLDDMRNLRNLYRQTAQGADYTSEVLDAALSDREKQSAEAVTETTTPTDTDAAPVDDTTGRTSQNDQSPLKKTA